VGRAIEKKASTIRIPVSTTKRCGRLVRTETAIRARTGRAATTEEIAEETGWDAARIERARNETLAPVISLDQKVSQSGGLRYSDVLPDDTASDPFDSTVLNAWSRNLSGILSILTPQERTVLRWRFGLADSPELTLEEIGQRFGLSRERIRQIQERALSKLRRKLELDAA
jgi:RNA polymerase primary sigma factor